MSAGEPDVPRDVSELITRLLQLIRQTITSMQAQNDDLYNRAMDALAPDQKVQLMSMATEDDVTTWEAVLYMAGHHRGVQESLELIRTFLENIIRDTADMP